MMPLTELNKRTQRELRSLASDGWLILYTLRVGNQRFVGLRHSRKVGLLDIIEEGRTMTIKRQGKIVKQESW